MTKSNLDLDECLALLRDPSLKAESIVEEMECAGAGGIGLAAVEAARGLLARFAQAAPGAAPVEGEPLHKGAAELLALPPLLASAVLRACGEAGRQELLREAAVSRDK